MKKSMFDNTIAVIINALGIEDEAEEARVEELLRASKDSYEFYGEDKYSSPEEARRESRARLERLALTTPATGSEWKWAKALHDACREWAHWCPEVEVRLRKTGKTTVALDFMRGKDEGDDPWYPADRTLTIDIVIAGQKCPCNHVIASLYKGLGKGENRHSVLTDVESGPLMAVLSLIEG